MARLSVPTKGRLPSSLRVDATNPTVVKNLNRLSRDALISLAINWLDDDAVINSMPYLQSDEDEDDEDDDDLYPPCRSVVELQQLYIGMQQQKGSKRDVVSRILEGDWRMGVTLYQLATVDFVHLDEHPASQKWTAYKILPLRAPTKDVDDEVLIADDKSLEIPRFHPSTFLQNLQNQALPDIKAHYHFYRPKEHPVLLLRIFVIESPYNSNMALSNVGGNGVPTNFTTSRTMYLAFPDGSSHLYLTKSQTSGPVVVGESKSLQSLVISGVPKALSRPRERYTLKPTNLTSKNLEAILDRKGPGRGNAAGGGWSIYTDERAKQSPLDPILPTPPLSRESSSDSNRKRPKPLNEYQRAAKRAKVVAKARFGNSGLLTDGKGVERVDITIEDPFPIPKSSKGKGVDITQAAGNSEVNSRRKTVDAGLRQTSQGDDDDDNDDDSVETAGDTAKWRPNIKITLHGSHVFAGIRQLVEAGIIDGERMPGWMTGEDGVTVGVVRHGRIRGNKGSGL